MTNEHNPFIAFRQQQQAETDALGLGDLSVAAVYNVKDIAQKRIKAEGITDEVERQKVYSETIRHFEEAYGYDMTYSYEYRKKQEVAIQEDKATEERHDKLESVLEERQLYDQRQRDTLRHLSDLVAGKGYADFCRDWWKTHNHSLDGCYEAWKEKQP